MPNMTTPSSVGTTDVGRTAFTAAGAPNATAAANSTPTGIKSPFRCFMAQSPYRFTMQVPGSAVMPWQAAIATP